MTKLLALALPLLLLAAAACRGPAGLPAEPLQPFALHATPVPEARDRAAHDLAAAALGGTPDDARAALARLEALEREQRASGAPPSGLVPWGQHLVDATLDDPLARRRANEQLLARGDLDPALRRQLELDLADDPLKLADQRIFDSRRARIARGVNAFAEAAGRSMSSTVLAPIRLLQAAIGVAVAEHMDDPISVQERQALAHWKQYVETHPGSPETPRIVRRIERMQQRWFSMKRERSVRAARAALEQGSDDIALVLASRALAYAPEDGEATGLLREAERRVGARRAARARSLEAAPDAADDARAAALARALLAPDGDVEGAARAILETGEDDHPADAARFALALAADERGEEVQADRMLARIAGAGDAASPMARHARQLRRDPDSNPYGAFRTARRENLEDRATFVLLGPLADGVRDRDLPTPVEWLLEGPALVSTLGGIPARLVQTAVAGKPGGAPAVYAERYLERRPDGAHAGELRAWLVDHYEARGDAVRAHAAARDIDGFDAGRLAALEAKAATQMLEAARRQRRRDLRLAMLSEVTRRHPDTDAGREAAELAARELEAATAQSIRISRGFLLENPHVAGPAGLDLKPELLDGRAHNGELHPEGVRLVGGRVLEFALLARSGDEDAEPVRMQRRVSEERLGRLVAMLEETASRNALLDPLAEQAPDSLRDLFFERARLGLADETDPRPSATSTYAFVGVREKYGMVRSRESILPVEFVIQGSFPDLGFGAFPRLRMPKTTPDAILYR